MVTKDVKGSKRKKEINFKVERGCSPDVWVASCELLDIILEANTLDELYSLVLHDKDIFREDYFEDYEWKSFCIKKNIDVRSPWNFNIDIKR